MIGRRGTLRAAALFALVVGWRSEASAQTKATRPRFDYRGDFLGDPIEKLGMQRIRACHEREVGGEMQCDFGTQAIGGEDVTVLYSYFDGCLYRVSLLFDPGSFDHLAELFTARYGSPDDRTRFASRTIAGHEDLNTGLTWRFRGGAFAVLKYGSSLTRGFAAAELDAPLREIARRKAARVKADAARDLGKP